ncbi:MAG TPA: DUF302 domain-containing protein [candidate division Zixibacteria bacterium]|nr:DUF302 domain-containing protein [candidate division Zixibacteria bacterium]
MNTTEFTYKLQSDKAFDDVVENLKKQAAEHSFRVLAIHDVQNTLKEKGIERGPLKIIEVCNAGFAHQATQQEVGVAIFMPCRFSVHTESNKTFVTLGRPGMIATMFPEAGLDQLASEVETTLKSIMEASV